MITSRGFLRGRPLFRFSGPEALEVFLSRLTAFFAAILWITFKSLFSLSGDWIPLMRLMILSRFMRLTMLIGEKACCFRTIVFTSFVLKEIGVFVEVFFVFFTDLSLACRDVVMDAVVDDVFVLSWKIDLNISFCSESKSLKFPHVEFIAGL